MPTRTQHNSVLPDTGEQVLVKTRQADRDFSLVGTISKRTVHGFECIVNSAELEKHLPASIQKRTVLGFLKLDQQKIEIEIAYSRENSGVHKFSSLASLKQMGSKSVLILEIPSEVRKSQRRKDYRLPLAAKVVIYNPAKKLKISSSLVNLSATGAMVDSSVQIQAGERVSLMLVESSAENLDPIDAVVIECISRFNDSGKSKFSYTLRLAFDDGIRAKLPSWQKEQIAHYIFEQQRQALKLRNLVG
jgi:hypothetical protein